MGGLKRVMMTSSLAVASLCLAPGESKAIFHWFRGCCGTQPAVAVAPVVAPAVAAVPSCNPCQQTVAYVPQTTYRVQYVSTPVTTFRPVSACGPCGTATTAFMPVTTMQTQAQVVPTTSFRLVYPTPAVATTSFYTPVTANYAVAAPAASSCCSGTTTAAYVAPAQTVVQQQVAQPAVTYQQAAPQPVYQQQSPTMSAQPPQTYANGNQQPTLQSAPPQQPQQYEQQQPAAPQQQQSPSDYQQYRPIPDPSINSPANPTSTGPTLNSPARTTLQGADDRWASAQASPTFQTVSARSSAPVDDGGWRPAR